ncbi:MAG: general secretion pathway protein GspF, partial [Lysobacterales bacterium]
MFIIKSRRKRALSVNQPLKHESHKRPVTRRDFLAQGFMSGAATVVAPSMLGMLMNPRISSALSPDIADMATNICRITAGAGKVPFICFDLAGGANIVGSNVLVGKEGGQLDFLSTQGYSKQGLPGTMLPNNATTNFINTELGLAFHSDSAFLRGILEKTSPT